MSLFDDLLKQTTPTPPPGSQSGGNPPQDDPLGTMSPIVISESTPMVSVREITQPQIEVPAGTPMNITQSDHSIIIDESAPELAAMAAPIQIQEDITPVVTATSDAMVGDGVSPLFAMTETVVTPAPVEMMTAETPEDDISALFEAPVVTVVPLIPEEKETEITFHDTNEYIEHAIDEVSDLIDGIDAEDATTLAEEEEHRKQKEHFAELEIADEATHQKHLEERAHAEKMRKYLEKEQGAAAKKIEEKEAVAA